MYSVVLMMALSGSAEVPAWGHRHSCDGGCYGGGYSSCYGGGGSCWGGGSCSGSCYGGGHHRQHGHRHSCHGGDWGSCSGGCYGGCHGGHGGWGGCHGGYGGCHGGYGGCWSSGYGSSYGGCCGSASVGCYGGGYMSAPMGGGMAGMGGSMMPHDGMMMPPSGGMREKTPAPKKESGTMAPAPATIFVRLPADAKLTVDGVATQSTSATRVFSSPTLEAGKEFSYTLKAQIVRDGRTLTTTKEVAVRAGSETRIAMEFPEASLAQR